jgi:hypothetical protein
MGAHVPLLGLRLRCDSRDALLGPLSLRVTSESGKTLVANNVIPNGWKGDTSYSSNVQFR